MTFEEFFKKKKINLPALQNAEPGLFAEFKSHFEQMGERSFDHTKKYWFNQLRHRFPAPVEPKVEKVHLENPIAEQTITESLTEPVVVNAASGVKARFKSAMANKPVDDIKEAQKLPEEKAANQEALAGANPPAENTPPLPAVGFKPRFKAGIVNKPAEEKPIESSSIVEKTATDSVTPATPETKPTVGFKPRFKASMVNKPDEHKQAGEKPVGDNQETEAAETPLPASPDAKPAVGFKPRFKAGTVSKSVEDKPVENPNPEPEAKPETTEEKPAEAPPKPMGFKPRFKPKE